MRDGKSTQSRYSALPARDVELVALSHIKERFELAPKSHIAEEAVRRTSEALKPTRPSKAQSASNLGDAHRALKESRVKASLPSPKWARRLAEGLSVTAVRQAP